MKKFVDACTKAVLHHKFWDVCLVKYLTTCLNFSTAYGAGEAAECWMYLWRHDPDLDHSCAAPAGLAGQKGFEYALRRNLSLYCSLQPSYAHSRIKCAKFVQQPLELAGVTSKQVAAAQKQVQKLVRMPEFQQLLYRPEYS